MASKINRYHLKVRGRENAEHFFKIYKTLPDAEIKTQVLSSEDGVTVNDYFVDLNTEDLLFLRLSCNIEYILDVDEFIRKRDEKINT